MLGYIEGVSKELGLVFQKNLDTFNSDCIPFAQLGIPSVSIEKCLGKGSFHYHTSDDTAINSSARRLAAPIKAATGLLTRILNSEIYPIERKIDSSLKNKIKSDVYKYTGEKKSLLWS
ncbi:MAG: M28 family peptidase [Desulfobacula sp.]|nr:M28 family peptidase [Desulfobacula sp.]